MTISLEYLAGFFDGEGCIAARGISRSEQSKSVTVQVSNTYKPILLEFAERFGGAIYEVRSPKTHYKRLYTWQLLRQMDMVGFLLAMQPLLLEKRKQADIALDILSIKLKVSKGNVSYLLNSLAEAKKLETPR